MRRIVSIGRLKIEYVVGAKKLEKIRKNLTFMVDFFM